DAGVSLDGLLPSPAHGRAAKASPELGVAHGEQRDELGSRPFAFPGAESGVSFLFGFPVPRADDLADVAAPKAAAHGLPVLLGDHAGHLGDVREAFVRVHPEGPLDGAGGAGPDAAVARAAGTAYGRVGLQLDVGHYLGEEYVGAVARRVDAGVLPKPADAGPDGDGPFHRRTGVDEGRKGHRATDPLREEGDDGVELFLENRMVVSPPRVAGDQAPELAARRRV